MDVLLRGRSWAPTPVRPGITKAEDEGGKQKEHESEHGRELNHRQPQHGKANRERRRERAWREEPGEHAQPPDRVQRIKEDEKVPPDTAESFERGEKYDREADDQPPDQLIVEPELPEGTQRRADPSPAEPMINRPRECQRNERLQREQGRKDGESDA